MNGFTEVLTWILCSHKENFAMLNRNDDGSAVIIANPRSSDFEVCILFISSLMNQKILTCKILCTLALNFMLLVQLFLAQLTVVSLNYDQ